MSEELGLEAILAVVGTARAHTAVILRKGENYDTVRDSEMGHLRHIFAMRAAGQQVITLPVTGEGEIRGIGIFLSEDREEVERLVAADPGVTLGRLTYELISVMGIPGDALPS